MSKPKIYIYNKCNTCRNAKKYLESKGVEFDVIAIREHPPSVDELAFMLSKYDGAVRKLFNTSGIDYREGDYKTKLPTMSVDEALRELSQNGNLIKRPFLIHDSYGKVGFKEDEWDSLPITK